MWPKPAREFAETVIRKSIRLAVFAAAKDGRRSIDWIEPLVFSSMIEALDELNIPRKVSAEMLGVSKRGLLKRIQREAGQGTRTGLFSAVLVAIGEGSVSIENILETCSGYDAQIVRSMIRNLTKAGVLTQSAGRFSVTPIETLDREHLEYVASHYQKFPSFGVDEARFRELYKGLPFDLQEIWNSAPRAAADISGEDGRWLMMTTLFSNTDHFISSWLTRNPDLDPLLFFAEIYSGLTTKRSLKHDQLVDLLSKLRGELYSEPDPEQGEPYTVTVVTTFGDLSGLDGDEI